MQTSILLRLKFLFLHCTRGYETQHFNLEDKFTIRHDPPVREASGTVGVVRRAVYFCDLTLGHVFYSFIPALNDIAQANLELKRLGKGEKN